MKKHRCWNKREAKLIKCRDTLRILLAGAGLVGIGAEVHADIPTGIIGSNDLVGNAYAALVLPSGALAPVAGLPAASTINSTAMNLSGFSLIGGQNFNTAAAYAATVSPTGTLTPLPLVLTGNITNVALSPSNNTGLIAGTNFTTMTGFAAFVLPDGTIFPASGFDDVNANTIAVDAAAVNCSNVGLIGAEGDDTNPYAAYVYTNGTLTPITIPPQFDNTGTVGAVALNKQGLGIIGGVTTAGAFAAYVTPNGGAVALPIPSLSSNDFINAVAINNAGLSLIGGFVNTEIYAAYATPQGVLTPLALSPPSGFIFSVALNSSGAGIIGGQAVGNIFGALVQPNGSVTPINTGTITGQINSVAISEAGLGLIGGVDNDTGTGYAALVAPNGAVTPLDVSAVGVINGVDLSGKASCTTPSQCIFEEATPKSIGPYLSVAYTQLAASYALDAHFIEKNCACNRKKEPEKPEETEETADLNPKTTCENCRDKPTDKPHTIWVSPFGNMVHVQERGKIPRYNNQIAGMLIAYDHQSSNYLVGAGVGYAFDYVSYGKGRGHGKINDEMACVYGSYDKEHLKINAALWGGFYQFRNIRHAKVCTIKITSKGKTHGWTFSPHLEISSPLGIGLSNCNTVEPFVKFDWVNDWQHRFTETGKAGLNLKVHGLYYSLLQSEAGLRFYEKLAFGWGYLCLEEKISYVNQAPFHVHSVRASFVGATSSFPVAIASDRVENLVAAQLMASFTPRNSSYPYGGFTLQTMANGSYQSYLASLFVGIEF